MRKIMSNSVFGSVLLFLAVVLFIVGTQNVVDIQSQLMLDPTSVLPVVLCIAVPSVIFLIGAIKAFKGELTLGYKSEDRKIA